MKTFLKKIALFVLLLVVFIAAGIIAPATPRAKTSMLFAKIKKDSLLQNVASPRLILIGGSSMSMSLNSQRLKDSLGLNPVNTGVHAAIGLTYMLDHTIKYVRKGDVVLLAPEYDQFYGEFAYGSQELMRTAFDVKTLDISELRWKQVKNIIPFLPQYAFSKLRPSEYLKSDDNMVYLSDAFNKFGDCTKRSASMPPNTLTFGPLTQKLNPEIFEALKKFESEVHRKGAKMILTFPAFQEASYNNSASQIKTVENKYYQYGFNVIGTPQEYRFANALMYDTPYHLTTKGIEIRTQMLIHDLIFKAHLKRKHE